MSAAHSHDDLGVVIIAGGAGRRLAAALPDRPKALAPLGAGTLLDHQLARVAPLRPGVVCVLTCARHAADQIGTALAGRARLLVEPEPLGTAGGLHLLPTGPTRWLTVNVDHVSDVKLAEFVASARPPCAALVVDKEVTIDEGVVELGEGGRLLRWTERPRLRVTVTTGLYVFAAAALRERCRGQALDMPALVQDLAPEGVFAHRHAGAWIDAGTPARLAAAAALAAGDPPPDGT
ncbi:MAG: NTP transferase domain-containing protein [Deltaproteobacteria bacterium]|nr:NTP transferase domain-containing protein [Deltaproteobacteria bacterium]